MKRTDFLKLFRGYAARPDAIPDAIVAATLRDLSVARTPEIDRRTREHLQQVFWLASRGLEPVE